jgi:nicotinamidase/pyrazinamidase
MFFTIRNKIKNMKIELEENAKILVVFNKTASHNVDPQKGFTPLCPNELPVPDGDNIVDELNAQNNLVKYKTVSKDIHPGNAIWLASTNNPQFSPVEGTNVDVAWNAHCMSGTFGAELLDGLPKMIDYDFFVAKGFEPDLHPYSSCYHDLNKKISTGLIEWFDSKDLTTVIIAGLALDFCVYETCKDLSEAGFEVILNLGGSRGIRTEEEVNKSINDLINNYSVIVIESFKDIEVIY